MQKKDKRALLNQSKKLANVMQSQSKIDTHNFVNLCKQKGGFRDGQKKAARKYKTQINTI